MIPNLQVGQPIDYPTLNAIIDRLNDLDDADHMKVVLQRGPGGVKYSTNSSKLLVQAFRNSRKVNRSGTKYYGDLGKIEFPDAFIAPPVVLVGFENSYLVPHVNTVTTAHFNLGALRVTEKFEDISSPVMFNVIAIGATRA